MSDVQRWSETPAGQFREAMGISGEPDREVVERVVGETREHYRRVYGRELSDAEAASVRLGAELRSAAVLVPAGHPVSDLVAAVNAQPGAGWSYTPEFRGPGATGIAVLAGGEWTGDARVIESARQAEAEHAARLEAGREMWTNGPAIMRTIAGPS